MARSRYSIDPIFHAVYKDWEARSGHVITSARQQRVLAAVEQRGRVGITSRELAKIHSKGDVSGTSNWAGAFNFLHKAGLIEKLADRRERHGVYVLPECVRGRETVLPYNHGDRAALVEEIVALWESEEGWIPGAARDRLSKILGVDLPTSQEIRAARA